MVVTLVVLFFQVSAKTNKADRIENTTNTTITLRTNNEKGSGLGLKLCNEFVEKNNGNICVESEEGKGT